MIDFYVSFFLILISILTLFIMSLILVYKSFSLSEYLKRKNKELYLKAHGIVQRSILGLPMLDNITYLKWVFADFKNEDRALCKKKKSLRSVIFMSMIPLGIIILCSIYLYIKFNVLNLK